MNDKLLDNVTPKLSVVIPVYNVQDYLEECVYSVVKQTYSNLEIIIVDDGSTDKSGEICDCLKDIDNRIKVIHQVNAGLSAARNTGIDSATGEYIAFVDSDDWIETTMYEKLMMNILKSGKDMGCCGRYVVSEDGKKTIMYSEATPIIYSNKEALKKIFKLESIDVAAWDKVYKKELFNDIKYPVGEVNEDAAIIIQLLRKTNGIVHVGEALYNYRHRWGSITKSGYSEKLDVVYWHLKKMKEEVNLYFPSFKDLFKTYEAYVSYCMTIKILRNPSEFHKYKCQYNQYIKILSSTYTYMLTSKNVGVKDKIRCIMAVLRIFKPIYCLKHNK